MAVYLVLLCGGAFLLNPLHGVLMAAAAALIFWYYHHMAMKYFGGMTIREIADSLELPYETVKKRHQRSLHKLRRQQDC